MYLLYPRTSAPSGRTLRRILGCHGGMLSHYELQGTQDALIRYGVSRGPEQNIVLNTAEAVSNAADKLRSLELLREAGVLVPPFGLTPEGMEGPVFGRARTHQAGRDIAVYDDPEQASGHAYYTQYIPSLREQRIHIFNGEMIHSQLKVYEGEEDEPEIRIRNHSRGYVFRPYVRTRPDADRIQAAVGACASLGLAFAAVDVLVGTDGRAYILECNTAPGCTPRTAEAYARAFHAWAAGMGIESNLDLTEIETEEEDEA